MIKRTKYQSVSYFIIFGLYQMLPLKLHSFLLTHLPESYLALLNIVCQAGKDEVFVGYEAGWPAPLESSIRKRH